jgi:hypothetical protein
MSETSADKAIAQERDVVKDIETLVMGKTAPKDRQMEWLLLYLAGSEIRALRLLCATLREQLISDGIAPLVVKYDASEGVNIITSTFDKEGADG